MSKIALVTCRRLLSQHSDVYESFPENLSKLLIEFGYSPLAITNQLSEKSSLEKLLKSIKPSLIVLAGGENIGENLHRDLLESSLLDFAAQTPEVRVWGICRGMQLMATHLGGEILPVDNHAGTYHKIFDKDTLLGDVNSFHHFQVSKLPESLEATSVAEDGNIESMRHLNLPWFACMWHPERMEVQNWMKEKMNSELFR